MTHRFIQCLTLNEKTLNYNISLEGIEKRDQYKFFEMHNVL